MLSRVFNRISSKISQKITKCNSPERNSPGVTTVSRIMKITKPTFLALTGRPMDCRKEVYEGYEGTMKVI